MHLPSGVLFRLFDADRLLRAAARRGARRFATAWVRGLGDVPFIVGEFARHVRSRAPGAELTVLARPGLQEALRWCDAVSRVVVVDEWRREQTLSSPWGLAYPPPWEIVRALARRSLEVDAVLPYPLGRWYDREPERRRPSLRWSEAEARSGRDFLDRVAPDPGRFVIAVNAFIGTGRYYDHDKEWGIPRFAALIDAVLDAIPEARVVLVDAARTDGLPRHPRVIDARGTLGVAESVSVIAAADLFVGLDAAHANLVYFLEGVSAELIVVLGRTSCFTPLRYPPASPGVKLTPIVGAGEDVHAVSVDAVLAAVREAHARRRAATRA